MMESVVKERWQVGMECGGGGGDHFFAIKGIAIWLLYVDNAYGEWYLSDGLTELYVFGDCWEEMPQNT